MHVDKAMTVSDKDGAVRLAIEMGSDAAADHLGISRDQMRSLRKKARTEQWYRKIERASLALSKEIGPRKAAAALRVTPGAMRAWRSEAGLVGAAESGMYAGDRIKAECVECGASMPEAGLCSDECRRDYIEAEGRA
jgi:hypothetical protein